MDSRSKWIVLIKPCGTRSFYKGEQHTNRDLCAVDQKKAWPSWHFSFGVPQVPSNKLCKAASWDQAFNKQLARQHAQRQVGCWYVSNFPQRQKAAQGHIMVVTTHKLRLVWQMQNILSLINILLIGHLSHQVINSTLQSK